jgi:hypothetical protein
MGGKIMNRYIFVVFAILLALLCPTHTLAASCSNTSLGNGFTCIVSASAVGTGFTAPTTLPVTTTGANLLVMLCDAFNAAACGASDSNSNSWSSCGPQQSNIAAGSRIFYVANPTVGLLHTFSSTVAGSFIAVAAISGASTSSPCDQSTGANTGFTSTPATGAITPSVNGTLLIAGVSAYYENIVTVTANNSMTVYESANPSNGFYLGGALALGSQTTAASINVTFTLANTPSSGTAANISDFKPTGGGPPPAAVRIINGGIL